MNDQDIARLADKLAKTLATKEDVQLLREDLSGVKEDVQVLREDMNAVKQDLSRLEDKIDTVLQFAESIDETVSEHGRILKDITSIPLIAHELRNPRS